MIGLALTVLFAMSGAYTCYLAIGFDAASPMVIIFYFITSALAWLASLAAKPRRGVIKWAWVALSLVVIYAIVSGPLNYLRLA